MPTGLVLASARRWRSFETLPPVLWVLAVTLLAATLLHADRFRWEYPLYALVAAWSALLLTLPVLHGDDFTATGPTKTAWVTSTGALLALGAYGMTRAVTPGTGIAEPLREARP